MADVPDGVASLALVHATLPPAEDVGPGLGAEPEGALVAVQNPAPPVLILVLVLPRELEPLLQLLRSEGGFLGRTHAWQPEPLFHGALDSPDAEVVERGIVGPDHLGCQEGVLGPQPPHRLQIGGGHLQSVPTLLFGNQNIVVGIVVVWVTHHLP